MLDIKQIRSEVLKIEELLKRRNKEINLQSLINLDQDCRKLITESESLQSEVKAKSKEIGLAMKENGNADAIKSQVSDLKIKKESVDLKLKDLEEKIKNILLTTPNIPHESVPIGTNEDDNIEVRTWGKPNDYEFEALNHDDLGVSLGILDFERAAKISGARFTFLSGAGAQLERALINFMLDEHRERGYIEYCPPLLVLPETMLATGQLPKFEEDLYKTNVGSYLIPTAEVPLTSLYKDEFINVNSTKKLTAYTPCFRSEAGSAGKDVKGMIRQHQFDKVELVKICHPDNSYDELESMTDDAENILRKLNLPYRTVVLCTGDMGFNAAKTYDIEVWLPGQNKYREISSCSNCTDFQARRANIKFKEDKKNLHVHTLNGSGLAVGRTLVAVLENYQQKDGSIQIPDVLVPYMNGKKIINKEGK
ncbi:MAG: serine--tRNA ligase [Planctomycetota bacterium]|nr:MAG: serine--tRNA ligase [Planctomycetota bacterium]